MRIGEYYLGFCFYIVTSWFYLDNELALPGEYRYKFFMHKHKEVVMRKIMIGLVVASFLFTGISFAAEQVRGHWRDTDRDGVKDTYVNPYERTSPNKSKSDNYGTPGNYNPNTGKTTGGDPSTYDSGSGSTYKQNKKYY